MRRLIPALALLLSVAVLTTAVDAQSPSTEPVIVEAQNDAPVPPTVAPPAPYVIIQQGVASQPGIGPSSNMQPGDYGYSAMDDLRQLNF